MLLYDGGGAENLFSHPWSPYAVWGLGWDGETFTASLVDSALSFAAARFAPDGTIQGGASMFGRASALYGDYDVVTDASDGTTVLVGGNLPGVTVVGRKGREASLTAPADSWSITGGADAYTGFAPAVALAGSTALIAWVDSDHGIFAREVSLATGEASAPWLVTTDPASVFQRAAAARVGDRWIVAGQDYGGLVVAEIRGTTVSQRRLLSHPPAACSATDTCGISSAWRWAASALTVATDGGSVWVGVVDLSSQRLQDGLTLFNYRILSTGEGCAYTSLGGGS